MQKTNDLVSVLIPCYNHEQFIAETIESVIAQDYDNIELIIIDDGSTDNSVNIIDNYTDVCNKRFKNYIFKKQANQGTASTSKNLIEMSSGDYVYFIASDDVALPDAISTLQNFLSQNKQYGLAVGGNNLIDAHSKVCYWNKNKNTVYQKDSDCFSFSDYLQWSTGIDHYGYIDFSSNAFGRYKSLFFRNYIPNGYLIRRSVYNLTLGFTIDAPLEDWFILMQLAKYSKFKFINKCLFNYRWHGNNTILKKTRAIEYEHRTRKYEIELVKKSWNMYYKIVHIEYLIAKKGYKLMKKIFSLPLKLARILRDKFLNPNQEKLNIIIAKLEENNNNYINKLNEISETAKYNHDIISSMIRTQSTLINSIMQQLDQVIFLNKISILSPKSQSAYILERLPKDKIDDYLKITSMQNNYKVVLDNIKNRVRFGHKVRTAFFVINDAAFPTISLFEKMLNDDIFEPFIIVIPDVLRGEEHMFSTLNKTYKTLSAKYDNVYMSYDFNKHEFINFSDKIDLICTVNPYDEMTYDFYKIRSENNSTKLAIYIPYGYSISRSYSETESLKNIFWKTFALEFHQAEELGSDNAVLLGYAKMDKLVNVQKREMKRKKIIIAPHHTVVYWEGGLNLSNFLNYSDFFIELPKRYPDIDFVFRPHPLLLINLIVHNVWSKEKVDSYLQSMLSNPNVIYDTDGDYFDTFVNSNALIHDCGSFMAEYMFTGNPQLYLLKSKEDNDKNFSDFANECISHHYHAYNEEDIINFINNVVVNEIDTMKEERAYFFEKSVKFTTPPQYNSKNFRIFKRGFTVR